MPLKLGKNKEQDWQTYEAIASDYLKRDEPGKPGTKLFPNTPVTGNMLKEAAKNTFNKYGILVPVELALAQGQRESHMGTRGKSKATNPFNVGEFDDKTTMTFKSTEEGVQAYFDLLAKDYLPGSSMESLMGNFVNKAGSRYATDTEYEGYLKTQIPYIQRKYK